MTSLAPTTNPIATRSSGEMRLCSNEYLTKNATPRKSANPPIHAKSFAPMNCSQLIGGLGGLAILGTVDLMNFSGIGGGTGLSSWASGAGVVIGSDDATASTTATVGSGFETGTVCRLGTWFSGEDSAAR